MRGWGNGHTIAAVLVGAGGVMIYQWYASKRAAAGASR